MLTYTEYRQKASRYARKPKTRLTAKTARMLREVARNWMTLAENHERFLQRAAIMGLRMRILSPAGGRPCLVARMDRNAMRMWRRVKSRISLRSTRATLAA